MKAVIVMPTIREDRFLLWLEKWKNEFKNHSIIIVEDNQRKTFHIPSGKEIIHYSWEDIDKELGKKSWIIPRRTDCIRSFGYYKAWQMKPDIIVTLDDDCYPDHDNFLNTHWMAIQKKHHSKWLQHFPGIRVRGVPYDLESVPTALNMGLWSNVPDLDAQTQFHNMEYRVARADFNFIAPHGYFAPICGMNVAFRPEIVPAYYFLLMGEGYKYDRFGDIWAGIFFKKICDHLGYAISGGMPYIRHDRASDPQKNLLKEKEGLIVNEYLWKDVAKMKLEGKNFKECYLSLACQLPEYSPYWKKLKEAMRIWADLF